MIIGRQSGSCVGGRLAADVRRLGVAQQSGSAAENAKTKPQRRKHIPKPGKALKWHVKGALPDVLPVCWLGRRR